MKKLALTLLACLVLGMPGCGPKVSPEDRAALQKALVAHWAKQDAKAQPKLKTAQVEGDKATIEFSLKYPEFHSIATTRKATLVKKAGQWTVSGVSE